MSDETQNSPSLSKLMAWLLGSGALLTVILLVIGRWHSSGPEPLQAPGPDKPSKSNHPIAASIPAARVNPRPLAVPPGTLPLPPAPAPQPEAILARLLAIDLSTGALSNDQLQLLNHSFGQLAAAGPAAVPAIRAFLEKGLDIGFAELSGGDQARYASLRTGLFDVLKDIGGPEGLEACLQVLRTSADPLEVAVLARNIEQMEPQHHREEIMQAARESLSQAIAGDLANRDVAPLFQVLQSFGDASVIADLENALPNWNYYSAITLASLPEGAGIPALVRQLEDPIANGGGQNDALLQVLTQVSTESVVARDALLDRAREGQISDAAWGAIANTLAGLQFEFGKPLLDGTDLKLDTTFLPKYRVETGDQTLYSAPSSPSFLEEQVSDRLRIVDQLLSSTSNPAAIEALQSARAALQSKALAAAIPQ